MPHTLNSKIFSFLIYGLGNSGKSTLSYLKGGKQRVYLYGTTISILEKDLKLKIKD